MTNVNPQQDFRDLVAYTPIGLWALTPSAPTDEA